MFVKVLKLSAQGLPQSWISLEQAVTHYACGEVRWELGTQIALFRGGHNAQTGLQSQIAVSSIIGTRGVPDINPFELQPSLTNAKLFQRDRGICAYCGGHFHEEDLTREHIVPVAHHGANHWMNVVTACKLWPPKNLPVGCVSEFRIRSREKNPVGGTRGHHQFGLRVRGRV